MGPPSAVGKFKFRRGLRGEEEGRSKMHGRRLGFRF